jgi:hypothetical protein
MSLLSLATALGLSAAAGLNVTLTLLVTAVLVRTGVVTVERPFAFLGSREAVTALAILAALEMVLDKTAGRRRSFHLLMLPVSVGAGVLLSAVRLDAVSASRPGLDLVLPLFLGALTAGSVYMTRILVRPPIGLLGFGPRALASWLEDVAASLLSLCALVAPVLVLVALTVLLVAGAKLALWMRTASHAAASRLGELSQLAGKVTTERDR